MFVLGTKNWLCFGLEAIFVMIDETICLQIDFEKPC
jgi:hypothetical protein